MNPGGWGRGHDITAQKMIDRDAFTRGGGFPCQDIGSQTQRLACRCSPQRRGTLPKKSVALSRLAGVGRGKTREASVEFSCLRTGGRDTYVYRYGMF
jgi:hypothetical protein